MERQGEVEKPWRQQENQARDWGIEQREDNRKLRYN